MVGMKSISHISQFRHMQKVGSPQKITVFSCEFESGQGTAERWVHQSSCVFASMRYLVMFWFGPWSHGLFSFLTHLFTGNQGAPQGLGREIQNTGPVAFWCFLSMLVPQADKQMTGGWGALSLNWSQSTNCRPKSPTKKRQSCKRHTLGFIAVDWEFLPGFCFAVPCHIACSGPCRMSDFGKESSKSMAEVSRLSALLEATGLAIPLQFPVDSEDLNRFYRFNLIQRLG